MNEFSQYLLMLLESWVKFLFFFFFNILIEVPVTFSCWGECCSVVFAEKPPKCSVDYETSPDAHISF